MNYAEEIGIDTNKVMTQEEIREEYRKCVKSFEYWRDHYLFHIRTVDDWQEIVYAMTDEFDKSLKEALDMYKEDRQKWVNWYNAKLLNSTK